ncbi:GMC oxidoreductase [Mesorhizobium sp. M0578]|uniref:GMC oxidoreductase n=1 Tax=unclassified Mesorhizobium TaxID=325217 RepID=UPI00333A7D9E
MLRSILCFGLECAHQEDQQDFAPELCHRCRRSLDWPSSPRPARQFHHAKAAARRLVADDRALEKYILNTVTGNWHPTSSCRMRAADDPSSVTSPDGRVRSVERLRVATLPSCRSARERTRTFPQWSWKRCGYDLAPDVSTGRRWPYRGHRTSAEWTSCRTCWSLAAG